MSKKLVDMIWQELCEKDDRTSPAEYPDMALITYDELAEFLSRRPSPDGEGGWREAVNVPQEWVHKDVFLSYRGHVWETILPRNFADPPESAEGFYVMLRQPTPAPPTIGGETK